MRNNKLKIILAVLALAAIGGFVLIKLQGKSSQGEISKEISPVIGTIQTFISTTGTVLPQNRLEVKPTVNGRLDQILVQEGEKVKKGQTLAWMSSTERAALLDAAQGQSAETLKYWEDVYKPIPVLSPIDGEVIVARTQPGQTITTTDDVIVLSDHLIVRAQVDETDIGKIKLKQSAIVTLDAYPDTKIQAAVEHIYYESTTVNNVTIYSVDLLTDEVPPFFRSGMNATIDFKAESRENVLVIPVEAVHKARDQNYVLLKIEGMKEPVKRRVTLGITDDKNFEVISGIDGNDKIIIKVKKYSLPKSSTGSNPFMPARPSSQPKRSGS